MKGTKEDDGDYQFNLFVDQQYKRLLNEQNNKQVNGMLVIEIIPKDQGSSLVQIPKDGDRIQAYGVWVTDNPHGWNELHPHGRSEYSDLFNDYYIIEQITQ